MRPTASFAFKFLFACGALWLLLWFVPATRIMETLAGANVYLFAAGLSLQFVNRGLATVPMKVIAGSQGHVRDRVAVRQSRHLEPGKG
jgi:hypothetical protein